MISLRTYKWWGVGFAAVVALLFPILLNYFIVVKPQSAADVMAPTPTTAQDTFENSITFRLSAVNQLSTGGVVVLDETGGKAEIRVSMDGEVAGIGPPQPITMHKGTCANLGDIKHTLTLVVGNKSTTVLPFGIDQLRGELPLAITVSSSWSDDKNYIACGDVVM